MPAYLYCLVTSAEPPPALSGVDGQTVRAVKAGRLTAWVSDAVRPLPPTADRARAHDAVVRRALAVETPIPARFGQLFADDAALAQSVDARGAALSQMLERVRDSVEMTIRIPVPAEETGDPASASGQGAGREYLERLQARARHAEGVRERAEFLQRRIALAARAFIRESSPASYAPPAHIVTLSHLIAHDAVPSYRHVLQRVLAAEAPPGASISGPWAPYSFAELPHD